MSLYLLVVLVIKEYITFNGVVTLNGVLVKSDDKMESWKEGFESWLRESFIDTKKTSPMVTEDYVLSVINFHQLKE